VSRDEIREAARSLLAEPLIDRRSPAALTTVRRHRTQLARWFAEELGYRLDATRPGVARLAKMPGAGHQPRGLRTRGERPFDGRRYALVCLMLAAAEAAGERTTLAHLFERVAERVGGIEGLAFDSSVGADRRVFIQAVQACVDLGVFEKADGDEERFARGEPGGDALYRIDRDRLSLLPTAPQPPSLAAGPEDVATEAYPDTEEGRNRQRRQRVMRALVEQPIVYRDDLSPEELDYLVHQRPRFEKVLAESVGLTLEIRAEGWVAVDEAGDLTDLRFPDYGAASTAALRLCDELRARRRRGDPDAWPVDEATAFVLDLAREYAGYWKKDAGDATGARQLTDAAVDILVAARLAQRGDGALVALAGAGRFAATEAIRPEPAASGAVGGSTERLPLFAPSPASSPTTSSPDTADERPGLP